MKHLYASCRTRSRAVRRPCWFRLRDLLGTAGLPGVVLPAVLVTVFLAMAALVMAGPAMAQPVEITDDLDRVVRLDKPAMRVVCLYGGLTESVAGLGRGDTLVARTQADNTPEFSQLPSVGTHMRPNLELIVGLAPDLVLQQGGRTEALEVVADLERLGVPVALFNPPSFQELFHTMQRLGVLLDAQPQARELVSGLQARLAFVEQALRNKAVDALPQVVFEIRYPNLLCAGQASMVSEIIQRAGGSNAVQAPGKVVRLSEEELIRLDPQAYVIQQGPMNPNPTPLSQRPLFRDLACTGNTLVVEEALFSRPGPRSVLAVEQLARFLHPQCFPETGEQ